PAGILNPSVTMIQDLDGNRTNWRVNITINPTSTDGPLTLRFSQNHHLVTDDAGNTLVPDVVESEPYFIDRTPPSVESITRYLPTTDDDVTNDNELTWEVYFTEVVNGVTASAFGLRAEPAG